jgi:aminopeptidase N
MRLPPIIASLASLLMSLATVLPTCAEAPFNFDTNPGKLSKDVVPIAYRIELAPNFEDLDSANIENVDFAGKVEIDVDVRKPTGKITLNAAKLEPKDVSVDGAKPKEVEQDKVKETWTLHFDRPLPTGPHKLAISYAGKIVPEPTGIYYSTYDDKDGKKIRFLTTQFEPAHARKMFPGWDEPAFKAKFTLSVLLPDKFKDYLAVSNTKIAQRSPAGPNVTKITFEQTPAMSSYLAVLTVGKLERTDPTSVAGVEVAVVTPIGRKEQGSYAVEVTAKTLPYYNEYFDVSYPLPKLDHIAVPNFEVGGMENWGGITYLDRRILIDKDTTQDEREQVFETIAHEISHQWFGDLVTMGWWNDLWLNESFANWMQKKATNEKNPSWNVWIRAHADKEEALVLDALRTTHPLQVEVVDESQMETTFDAITYNKGGAVIRMIEDYLGDKQFRDGLRGYMKDRAYKNAAAADLWAKLVAVAPDDKKNLAAIAASFTEHPGVPLIHVETSCSDDKNKTIVTLRQARFTVHDPLTAQGTWEVPVRIGRAKPTESKLAVVGAAPARVEFDGCDAAVKVNFGDTGYYRARYHGDAIKRVNESYCSFQAADRVNLLSDSWALTQASPDAASLEANVTAYLELTRRLSGEDQLVVWTFVIDTLRQIDNLVRGTPVRAKFREYARMLLQPRMSELGWPKPGSADEPQVVQLRGLVITTLGRFRDPAVVDKARELFRGLVDDPNSIDSAELKTIVVTVVGYGADADTYQKLQVLAGKAKQAHENYMIYYNAMAGASDPVLIKKSIDLAADTEEIQRGSLDRFIARMATSSDNPERVWQLVSEIATRDKIFKKLTAMKQQRLLPSVALASAAPDIAYQLKWTAQSRDSGGARYEADKAAEQIEFKADFKPLLLPALERWLALNPQPLPPQRCQ